MDFLKKVLYSSIVYFAILLVWILFAGQKMDVLLLSLQALSFGVIFSGFQFFVRNNSNPIEGTFKLKDDEEELN